MLLFEKRVFAAMGEESYTKLTALLEEEARAIEQSIEQGSLFYDAASKE